MIEHTHGPLEVIGPVPLTLGNGESVELFEITTAHEPYADFDTTGYTFSREDADLYAAAPDLLELLDDVSAALETVMVHYEKSMPPADQRSRRRLVRDARQLVRKLWPLAPVEDDE